MNWDDLGFVGGLWLDACSFEYRAELVSTVSHLQIGALAPTCTRFGRSGRQRHNLRPRTQVVVLEKVEAVQQVVMYVLVQTGTRMTMLQLRGFKL